MKTTCYVVVCEYFEWVTVVKVFLNKSLAEAFAEKKNSNRKKEDFIFGEWNHEFGVEEHLLSKE